MHFEAETLLPHFVNLDEDAFRTNRFMYAITPPPHRLTATLPRRLTATPPHYLTITSPRRQYTTRPHKHPNTQSS